MNICFNSITVGWLAVSKPVSRVARYRCPGHPSYQHLIWIIRSSPFVLTARGQSEVERRVRSQLHLDASHSLRMQNIFRPFCRLSVVSVQKLGISNAYTLFQQCDEQTWMTYHVNLIFTLLSNVR